MGLKSIVILRKRTMGKGWRKRATKEANSRMRLVVKGATKSIESNNFAGDAEDEELESWRLRIKHFLRVSEW